MWIYPKYAIFITLAQEMPKLKKSKTYFWFQFLDNGLLFEIPDFDDWTGGGTEPVSIWWKAESIDFLATIQGMKWFCLFTSQIPKLGLSVSAAGCAQGTVWRNGNGVKVASVAPVVPLELAVGEVPDLYQLIPSGWDNNWVLWKWRKSNAWNPLAVALLLDGVFANTQSVPQFNWSITSGWNNLAIVSRKCDRKNILGVTNESASLKNGMIIEGQFLVNGKILRSMSDLNQIFGQTLYFISPILNQIDKIKPKWSQNFIKNSK